MYILSILHTQRFPNNTIAFDPAGSWSSSLSVMWIYYTLLDSFNLRVPRNKSSMIIWKILEGCGATTNMGKLQCFAIFEDRTAGSRPSKSPSCKAKSAGALCCKIPACSTDWLARWGLDGFGPACSKVIVGQIQPHVFPHEPHFGWDYFPIFSHLQSLNTKTLVHTVRARDTSLKDSHAHLFHQLLSQKHLPFFHSGFCLYADHGLTQFFCHCKILLTGQYEVRMLVKLVAFHFPKHSMKDAPALRSWRKFSRGGGNGTLPSVTWPVKKRRNSILKGDSLVLSGNISTLMHFVGSLASFLSDFQVASVPLKKNNIIVADASLCVGAWCQGTLGRKSAGLWPDSDTMVIILALISLVSLRSSCLVIPNRHINACSIVTNMSWFS